MLISMLSMTEWPIGSRASFSSGSSSGLSSSGPSFVGLVHRIFPFSNSTTAGVCSCDNFIAFPFCISTSAGADRCVVPWVCSWYAIRAFLESRYASNLATHFVSSVVRPNKETTEKTSKWCRSYWRSSRENESSVALMLVYGSTSKSRTRASRICWNLAFKSGSEFGWMIRSASGQVRTRSIVSWQCFGKPYKSLAECFLWNSRMYSKASPRNGGCKFHLTLTSGSCTSNRGRLFSASFLKYSRRAFISPGRWRSLIRFSDSSIVVSISCSPEDVVRRHWWLFPSATTKGPESLELLVGVPCNLFFGADAYVIWTTQCIHP